MSAPLQILHLEDSRDDAELVQSALESEKVACTITRVDTRVSFLAALESGQPDLILADVSLPTFDGMSALEIRHTKRPDTPFIFVSGSMGEELAIEMLKNGATDYVLKGRLARLVPAVRRAMREVEHHAERKRLEQQFIEAQKVEVIGLLAGGVAHDFNNILGVVIGYSDLILGKFQPADPPHHYAEQIRLAADRAVGLTRQLLAFGRKQNLQLVVLNLNDVVLDLEKMLRRLVDENIELVITPGADIGRVKADAGYIGQVLMNLVVNARDAMPNGGKLIIETSNVALDEHYTSAHAGVKPGPYVMLAVSDTGAGMTPEVKARMFEAFFTTKPKGKGTGLGLATCQTIVKQCGGHINVYSEPDAGAVFKIYLPRIEAPLDLAARVSETGPLPRGTETVLVVEDEPSVRHLAVSVLEAHGYTVLTASNGQEGLRVAAQHQGAPVRLVVTDVVMPLMGGKVMAEWLTATYPDLRVLYTSGYTEDAIAQQGVVELGGAFLTKPYTPAVLLHKARELLDQPPRHAA